MDQALSGWLSADELVHHRMETFHRERVAAIQADDAPFRLKDGPMLILHLIPAASVRDRKRFTASELKAQRRPVLPLGKSSGHERFNVDGYARHDGEGEVRAYSQLFRDGRLEAVSADITCLWQGAEILQDGYCEQAMLGCVSEYLQFCKAIGIPAPIHVFAALTGCQGIGTLGWDGFPTRLAVDRSPAFLPDLELDSLNVDVPVSLRLLCDCLSNAAGLERSLGYDEKGNRRNR